MSWVTELCEGFRALRTDEPARVSFFGRNDIVGELGREFNALADEWSTRDPHQADREQAHRLRNRLAGILAALHVLGETGALSGEERKTMEEVIREAKTLDARLRRS